MINILIISIANAQTTTTSPDIAIIATPDAQPIKIIDPPALNPAFNTVGAVGIGGAIGSISRYLVNQGVTLWLGPEFPYGTLLVNILGSFGFGMTSVWLTQTGMLAPWGNFMLAGFFGGFTTFSAFANDTVGLMRAGNFSSATWYLFGSVGLSIIALLTGQAIAPLLVFN